MVDKKVLQKQMGERLYAIRTALKWSQQYAAEKCELSQQTISQAESGKIGLLPDSILKICLAYGISADYLFTGNEDSNVLILDKAIRELDAETLVQFKCITEHFLEALRTKSKAEVTDKR